MKMSNFITLLGVVGFVGIVIYLHFVQVNYSPIHQLMSELALGQQGSLMLFAFLSLALSIASTVSILARCKAPLTILLLLSLASISMAGAGIFKLGAATSLHVGLVGLAFVLLGLAMYLVPLYVSSFQKIKSISWGLGIGMVMAIGLGNNFLPIGIGQRMATGCILLWLCWLTISNFNQERVSA